MDDMMKSEDKDLYEENTEVNLIKDIIKEVIEYEKLYDHPTEGFLVSD